MQVLNRNWKNYKNNIQEVNEVIWNEDKIYLYINNLSKNDLVLSKLRNSNKEIYGTIEEVEYNGKSIYVAYFESKIFDNKLNSIWDFYVTNETKKTLRLKSNLDIEKISIYKLPNKNIQLQPYNTVQYNFSLKVLKSMAITKIKDMYIDDQYISIDLNMLTDKSISNISIFEKNDKLNGHFSISNKENINNYINNTIKINYPIEKILEDVLKNKASKLFLTITYIDRTDEKVILNVRNNFINDNVVFNGKKVCLYENNNNIYIKYEEKQIEAQIKSIYSYSDKFIINGYMKYNLGKSIQFNKLLIVNRDTEEFISQNVEIIDGINFKSVIYIKDLLDNKLIDGVWDIYLNSGNERFRLEATSDDIENKQKTINIPQQMIGNNEDTYVYKLY